MARILWSLQFRPRSGGLFVRVRGHGADFKEVIRKTSQHEMPGVSYVTVTPFADVVAPQMRSWNLGATMFVAFGGLALVLAGMGLYSVIAYNVAQRTHEMGVRLALGAQPSDLLRLVVGDGVRIGATGVAFGIVIALWASRFLEPLLFDTSPRDISIYSAVSGLVLAGQSWRAGFRRAAQQRRIPTSRCAWTRTGDGERRTGDGERERRTRYGLRVFIVGASCRASRAGRRQIHGAD